MARYLTATDENVALNGTIPFDIVSIPCKTGNVIPIATGVFTLRGGANAPARYNVKLQANVAIPEEGEITPLALAITLDGVALPDSVAIVTPTETAEAGEFWHINTEIPITVPCGCCVSVSAAYVDATEDDAGVTPTPSIFVRRRASLTVDRTA